MIRTHHTMDRGRDEHYPKDEVLAASPLAGNLCDLRMGAKAGNLHRSIDWQAARTTTRGVALGPKPPAKPKGNNRRPVEIVGSGLPPFGTINECAKHLGCSPQAVSMALRHEYPVRGVRVRKVAA